MDEDTKIIIQAYLAEAYRIYLKNCFDKEEKPNEKIKEYFTQKIKELESK